MGTRTGDSIVIDAGTRKVVLINGEPVTEQTPELQALVEEALGPKNKDEGGRMKDEVKAGRRGTSSEVDI
jgi:hypothetical protein